jgi:hypothetical protein
MNEYIDPVTVPGTGEVQPIQAPVPVPAVAGEAAVPEANGHGAAVNRHAEAGRKGARRVHQLAQLGLLYEKEHGLKRGRQRLRQLIQEGRLYEQEHGLSTQPRRTRRDRLAGDQLVQTFLRSLLRMVKPAHRGKLLRLLQTLDEAA